MAIATAPALENTVTFAKVGKPAPDFDLPSTKNLETLAENVKLSDYKGK
jgi:peroxiredoxin (alkyl hydroperoxide reductase subunit C)